MVQDALGLSRQAAKPIREVKEQTYWGAVRSKLFRDKITMAAIVLLLFMIAISLAAPWLADKVLGFDPTDTNLRNRNAPPTWADAAWAIGFYEKHGFRVVTTEEKDRLLKKYWSIPDRQIETSVVLAEEKWSDKL